MLQLLIDGHNLIGVLPGLSLADFDDEEKLVILLRKFAARRRARIVVVFDPGAASQAGGRSQALSGGGVESVFAGSHTDADRILIERIRAVKRPQDWALVSGDHKIQDEARRRHVRVIESAEFADRYLSPPPGSTAPNADEKPGASGDIDEWLELFEKK
ncbi:MAG TPA: NYN domain-containing protein [Anaerolineae bacterium]